MIIVNMMLSYLCGTWDNTQVGYDRVLSGLTHYESFRDEQVSLNHHDKEPARCMESQ